MSTPIVANRFAVNDVPDRCMPATRRLRGGEIGSAVIVDGEDLAKETSGNETRSSRAVIYCLDVLVRASCSRMQASGSTPEQLAKHVSEAIELVLAYLRGEVAAEQFVPGWSMVEGAEVV
jgi:hypothetical protein